jgi:membrane protein YqaA with SNARE-associated domain
MALRLSAFLWGLAEATLFFIVPDVLLSAAALNRLRPALVACAWATAGALLGGALMFAWGTHDPAAAWAMLDRIPAIDAAMQTGVREALGEHGLAALFLGPLTGTPYKLYAVAAGQAGLSLAAFLLVSIPARAVRFVLLCLLVHWISRKLPDAARLPVLAACWLLFYGAYFVHMGW